MPKIVTAHTGEPHITADDVGALHQKIIGSNDYLLSDNPEDFKAVQLDSSTIQLPEGEIVIQGAHVRILPTDKVKIENGQSGLNRIDIIAACYMKTDEGIESAEIKVIKGEPGTSPLVPLVIQSDIRNGGNYHEMPLFRVDINGVSIAAVTSVCETVKSLYSAFQTIAGQAESIKGLSNKAVQLEEKAKTAEANSEAIQKINTNNLLWSGFYYMNASQTVELSQAVSEQTNGIVLVFSNYLNGADQKRDCQFYTVPKSFVSKNSEVCIRPLLVADWFSALATKALYIGDKTIKGHAYNTRSGIILCRISAIDITGSFSGTVSVPPSAVCSSPSCVAFSPLSFSPASSSSALSPGVSSAGGTGSAISSSTVKAALSSSYSASLISVTLTVS